MNRTKIAWADMTWNTLAGCQKVSHGCKNCYAAQLASTRLAHLPAYKGLAHGGEWSGEIRVRPEKLEEPLRHRDPVKIFPCSTSDLFHGEVPRGFIDRVIAVSCLADWHEYIFCTKRTGLMVEYFSDPELNKRICKLMDQPDWIKLPTRRTFRRFPGIWPLKNVILLTTIEDQENADYRVPQILKLKTLGWRVGISAEPLLGPLNLTKWLGGGHGKDSMQRGIGVSICDGQRTGDQHPRAGVEGIGEKGKPLGGRNPDCSVPTKESREPSRKIFASKGNDEMVSGSCVGTPSRLETLSRSNSARIDGESQERYQDRQSSGKLGVGYGLGKSDSCNSSSWISPGEEPTLSWIIVGGESGAGARECKEQWVQDIYDQCKAAGVPFYFKQHGKKWVGNKGWWCDHCNKWIAPEAAHGSEVPHCNTCENEVGGIDWEQRREVPK